MRDPLVPGVESRRAHDFEQELLTRARAWMPDWNPGAGKGDPGAAVIAAWARLLAQVAERLDRVAEKSRRNLYAWLGVRGAAARGARVPVVFNLTASAKQAVLARARSRLQAQDTVFETEEDVRLVPARIARVVALDLGRDAYYLPAPDFAALETGTGGAVEWEVVSFAAAGSNTLQLDPPLGLAPELLLAIGDKQFRVTSVKADIVSVDPAIDLPDGVAAGTRARKVATFVPFDSAARNRQRHALYLGHKDLLNVESTAHVDLFNVGALAGAGVRWQYWGKKSAADEPTWIDLDAATKLAVGAAVGLEKSLAGAVEVLKVGGVESRWIRALLDTLPAATQSIPLAGIRLQVSTGATPSPPLVEGLANTNPLVLDTAFYPLGREPRLFDAFYLGCNEVFSKRGAQVTVTLDVAEGVAAQYAALPEGLLTSLVAGVTEIGALRLLRFTSGAPGQFSALQGREALQPGMPGIKLDDKTTWRPPMWRSTVPAAINIAVTAGPHVWVWRQYDGIFSLLSQWLDFGNVAVDAGSGVKIDALVLASDDNGPALFAQYDGRLNRRAIDSAAWTSVGPTILLHALAAVRRTGLSLVPNPEPCVVAVAADGAFHVMDTNHVWRRLVPAAATASEPATRLQPVARYNRVTQELVAFAADIGTEPGIRAALEVGGAGAKPVNLALNRGDKLLGLELEDSDTGATVVAAIQSDAGSRLLWWQPDFSAAAQVAAMEVPLDAGTGTLAGAPLRLFGAWAVPGEHGAMLVLPLLNANLSAKAPLELWADMDESPNPLVVGDMLTVNRDGIAGIATVAAPAIVAEGASHLPLRLIVPLAQSTSAVLPNRLLAARTSELADEQELGTLKQAGGDLVFDRDSTSPREFDSLDQNNPPRILTSVTRIITISAQGGMAAEIHVRPRVFGQVNDAVTVWPFGLQGRISGQSSAQTDIALPFGVALTGIERIVVSDAVRRWPIQQLHFSDPDAGNPPALTDPAWLDPAPPGRAEQGKTLSFWPMVAVAGETLTVLRLDRASLGVPPISAQADTLVLEFANATPPTRLAKVLTRNGGVPAVLLLTGPAWSSPPPATPLGETVFRVIAATGQWVAELGDNGSNPELTWEYSNGRGWWRLPQLDDGTHSLRAKGAVVFDVPDDIAASDWAGRSNFWIRARLTGGDYGKESFKVKSTTDAAGVTTQTVERSTLDVRAPVVVAIDVHYALNAAVYPEAVLTEDAGTLRNQTEANRTPAASVESFVPLRVQMAAFAGAIGAAPAQAAGASSACTCASASAQAPTATTVAAAAATTAAASATTAAAGDRCLMVGLEGLGGLDGVVQGEPVNLFCAVAAEQPLDALAPLRVDALVGSRFEPVSADDKTRALGESGLITMTVGHAPTRAELFGAPHAWLRLAPKGAGTWAPALAGTWLNAVWAMAAETQTVEVLGSSQGAPNAVFTLARPPVLQDTLVLRVNEPLDDEEIEQLRAKNHLDVRTAVDGLPGQWVLWSRVGDPADYPADARVYALDETTGDVRFGDGRRGMIPPIGRDNIVAFEYRRTEAPKPVEPDVPVPPAKPLAAGTALDLITPLEGVESSNAVLDAGTGAPADDAARVLRFAPDRLRHRGRAVTAADVEAIAQQALPSIAQVKCLTAGGRATLVVVMRGLDPQPPRAIRRELQQLLLAALPPAFGARDSGRVLAVVGPAVRRLRVRAVFEVASLDVAGGVSDSARTALQVRLDPATGGDDGCGWPLGRSPDVREITASLIDLAHLAGLASIELIDVTAGSEAPWPARFAAHELAVLADDGFDFTYVLTAAQS